MSKRPIDLSSLPPDLRRVVEQQLAKLPPQAREKLLREGSPIVEKMLAKLQAGGGPPPLPGGGAARHAAQSVQRATRSVTRNAATATERATEAAHQLARMRPHGHYNATIRPGDGAAGGRWLVVLVAAAALVAFYWR